MTTIDSLITIPEGYVSSLNIRETELAIKRIKDFFEQSLATQLNLTRVSAPLFVLPSSGLNDNLNGVEKPVSFEVKSLQLGIEIVQSLAKWKRLALKRYGFELYEGLYTDMNAIRKDEDTDNTHSIYVDQWDWEKVISVEQRNNATLIDAVQSIYKAMRETETMLYAHYPQLTPILPEQIHFVHAQELEDLYPTLSAKAREDQICQVYGAVFIQGIGHTLKSGKAHDLRAPDYDDWNLNGDILVYHPVLKKAFELSSMGVRVNADVLKEQLKLTHQEVRSNLPFHQALLQNELPQSIGGGIGQSRLCMFFLKKAHIGEVQASIWSAETEELCQKYGINLL